MASGEMAPQEFEVFLSESLKNARSFSRSGALQYVFMDWRHLGCLLRAAEGVYGPLFQFCVWNKTNAGMGSFYRSKHELVPIYRVPGAPHRNNIKLGRYGRNRTNVWDYPGATVFGKTREDDLAMHPTVKPAAMVADAILDSTIKGELVLDIFAGSGSTFIAAHQTGRVGVGTEVDPAYVDVIVKRLQAATGKLAYLEGTHSTFDEVADRRRAGKIVRYRAYPRIAA
jgi:hypothetical protein